MKAQDGTVIWISRNGTYRCICIYESENSLIQAYFGVSEQINLWDLQYVDHGSIRMLIG